MKISKGLLVFLLGTLSMAVMAQAAGTSGGEILKTPFGARTAAMAEAFTGMTGDLNVMHYNPAGLSSLEAKEIQTMYLDGFVDSKYLFLGYGQPALWGTLGGSVLYLDGGAIDVNTLSGSTIVTENKKAQQDFLFTLGYGRLLTKGFSFGLNAKILHSTLVEDHTATAYASDLGIQYQAPIPQIVLGAAIQNVGSKLKYDSEGDSLPQILRVGGIYGIEMAQQNAFKIAVDGVWPKEEDFKFNIGGEYALRSFMALRAGYTFQTANRSEQITGLSTGVGFRWFRYSLDYSFSLVDKLNDRHLISLGARF